MQSPKAIPFDCVLAQRELLYPLALHRSAQTLNELFIQSPPVKIQFKIIFQFTNYLFINFCWLIETSFINTSYVIHHPHKLKYYKPLK